MKLLNRCLNSGTSLQADDVRGVMPYLVEDALLSVVPLERPAGTVPVHLSRRVLVAQNVVAHHREDTCNIYKGNQKGIH